MHASWEAGAAALALVAPLTSLAEHDPEYLATWDDDVNYVNNPLITACRSGAAHGIPAAAFGLRVGCMRVYARACESIPRALVYARGRTYEHICARSRTPHRPTGCRAARRWACGSRLLWGSSALLRPHCTRSPSPSGLEARRAQKAWRAHTRTVSSLATLPRGSCYPR